MVNTGSGDGLLPKCTQPFPEPMSSGIHSRVMLTWILKTSIRNCVSYLHIWNQAISSRGQFELITLYCRCLQTLNKLQGSTYPITLLPGASKTISPLVDLSKDFFYNPKKYIERMHDFGSKASEKNFICRALGYWWNPNIISLKHNKHIYLF